MKISEIPSAYAGNGFIAASIKPYFYQIHEPVFRLDPGTLTWLWLSASCVSLIFAHKLIGVGIGTVVAVLGVGRVIAVFNHFFMGKMTELAGGER